MDTSRQSSPKKTLSVPARQEAAVLKQHLEGWGSNKYPQLWLYLWQLQSCLIRDEKVKNESINTLYMTAVIHHLGNHWAAFF
jgi:hypothetical protein